MRFVKESIIKASPESVFSFHEQPEALKLLLPPWETTQVIQPADITKPGSRAIVRTTILGMIPVEWIAEHTVYEPPARFEDVQIKGPFRSWRHAHLVHSHADGAVLRDEIDYEPPFGFLGRLANGVLIEPRLRRLFAYRHDVTRHWCEAGRSDKEHPEPTEERKC